MTEAKTRRPSPPKIKTYTPSKAELASISDDDSRRAYLRTCAAWPAEMMWKLGDIIRYTDNPRDNDSAVPDLKSSLVLYAARQPIVVWERDMVIVVGDTRWLAAQALGWPRFPVHLVASEDFTEEEAEGYRLMDNKSGERAEWNFPKLKTIFDRLEAKGFALGNTGFREFEITPIRESTWSAPEGSGEPGGDGSGTGEGDPPDEFEVREVQFDEEQWTRVVAFVRQYRADRDTAKTTIAECLTQLASKYVAGSTKPGA